MKLIKSIPNGKATGADNFQVKLIKLAGPQISRSLTFIFNLSLTQGKFPCDWKLARIAPIFKKGSKTDPGNYRPVSVLSVVSKFMERIVYNQLYEYLNVNNLLCIQQSGFRKFHSCQSSLHRLHEQLYRELYEGKVVGLVALDLRKAFDTVNHRIMLDKMAWYGIQNTEHQWFKSYLNDRFQICTIFNNISEPQRITCGVPQGSILGPLMFLLYVNDMPTCFNKCFVNLYADDTAFYVADVDVTRVNQVLQDELKLVYKWLCCNKLSLHVGKTSSMIICSRQKRLHLRDSKCDLSLDNVPIEQTTNLKYLGVTIDQDLRYDVYMKELVSKLNRALGILRRASYYVSQATRVTLFNTLVLPHIDYCSTIWYNNVSKSDIKKLQRLQNVGMRIILECHYRTRSSEMLEALRWLSVEQRMLYNMCCITWKIINKEAPGYLSNIISHSNLAHSYNTRSATDRNDLFNEHCHPKSLQKNATRIWNALPPSIRSVKDFYKFKKELVKHIRDINNS
jgi:hypothetical protein